MHAIDVENFLPLFAGHMEFNFLGTMNQTSSGGHKKWKKIERKSIFQVKTSNDVIIYIPSCGLFF